MSRLPASRHAFALALGLGLAAALPACLDPTEAVLDISTNAECSAVAGTGITAGQDGAVEDASYDTVTSQCSGLGDIGSIVLLPDDDHSGPFSFKVVTSLGNTPVESCTAPLYGPSCIVARRSMHFVPSRPFHVPLKLTLACAGVVCPDGQTCIGGTCVSSVVDPGDCEDPAGCDPETEIPPPWQKQFGGAGSQMARHVTRGADGVVAVTGNFDKSIELVEGGAFTSKGSHDIFLATYSPAGQLRWALQFGGSGDDEGSSVAFGPHGDVYLLASFEDVIDFGGGKITSHGGADLALVKVTAFGKLVWAQGLGGAGLDSGSKVAVDGDGNVYVSGGFEQTTSIAGSELVSAGGTDLFLASFTAGGQLRWAKRFGDKGDDYSGPVAVDDAGHVYTGGSFRGELETGGEPLHAAGTGNDVFLISFEPDGELRWAKSFGSDGQDVLGDMAARGDRVVCTGALAGAATIDGVALAAGSADGFVGAFDSDGNYLWSKVFGSVGNDQGTSIDLGEDGAVFLAGSVFIGPVFGNPKITGPGVRSPFVTVLESSGKLRWSRQLVGSAWADATGIAASPDGYAYFASWFTGKLSYGDTTFSSADAEDMVLLRMAPP